MSDPLRPDRAQREALAASASHTLEALYARRAASPTYVPVDPDLIAHMRRPPTEAGEPAETLFAEVELAASQGWDKSSGGNLSFIPNGALASGVVAATLASGVHAFTGGAHEAAALTALEQSIIEWMAGVVGLPAGAGGVLLSGGSLANQTAVATARIAVLGDEASDGVMYLSERAHHSVSKAARLAGIRPEQIRTVGTDRAGRFDVEELHETIRADRAAGHRPFLVVGVAGSTDTGSVDPLEELASVAAEAGAWFHIDAAYGGFFALTERGRARMVGLGSADSITVDAHKSLFLPYGVGAILVRDPATLREAHAGSGHYLRDVPTVDDLPHYFQIGPELTRPFRGMLVWFPLHLHGVAAFRAALDRMLDLAESAHARLAVMPGIEAGPAPTLSITTFRASAGDRATQRILDALNASGRFQVTSTVIGGRVTIRLAFLSPATTSAIVDDALAVIASTV
jgi:aromatic-L-amino-acid decarboxylase